MVRVAGAAAYAGRVATCSSLTRSTRKKGKTGKQKCKRGKGEEQPARACLSLVQRLVQDGACSLEAFLNDTAVCRNQGSPCQVGNRQEKGTCQRRFGLMTMGDVQWGTDQVPGSSFFFLLKQRKKMGGRTASTAVRGLLPFCAMARQGTGMMM